MLEFFSTVAEFFDTGLTGIIKDAFVAVAEWAGYWALKALAFKLAVAWDLFQNYAAQIDLSGFFAAALNYLPPQVAGFFYALGGAEVLNNLAAARMTALAIRVTPGL